MLRTLSGRMHRVRTGVALRDADGRCRDFVDETEVVFRPLEEWETAHYIERYRPFDKAGAYGIQEWIGAVGITAIRGSYFNVMGLPLHRVYGELQALLCEGRPL